MPVASGKGRPLNRTNYWDAVNYIYTKLLSGLAHVRNNGFDIWWYYYGVARWTMLCDRPRCFYCFKLDELTDVVNYKCCSDDRITIESEVFTL